MSDSRIVQRGMAKLQTTAGVLDAYATATITSADAKHEWENQTIKDFGGTDCAWDARNTAIKLTVKLELTATSQAIAIQYGTFLPEFAEVVLSNFDCPWMNAGGVTTETDDIGAGDGSAPSGSTAGTVTASPAIFTGSWCYYEGGSIELSNTKIATATVPLRKYKIAAVNAKQFVIPS